MLRNDNTVQRILQTGTHTSAELQNALHLSQSRISKLVAADGDAVVKFGAARNTRYGMRRTIRGQARRLPLYRVTAEATLMPAGEILPLAPALTGDVLVRAGAGDFLHEGFPYFLADMRPQGFLGRFFPQIHTDLELPADISRWSHDDVFFALAQCGYDLPGAWIVGERAAEMWLAARHAGDNELGGPVLSESERTRIFPELAARAMSGNPPGSSAGGEQPKFLCRVRNAAGAVRAVIVKFTPKIAEPVGTRWADLLCAEHVAQTTLRLAGVPAAATQLVQADNRLFLEVERFDRIGEFGRAPVVSFGALADALGCRGPSWCATAGEFFRQNLIDESTLARVRLAAAFAQRIRNSDTHLGNLSLLPGNPENLGAPGRFTLAPIYDMLPMDLRPRADNSLPDPPPAEATPLPEFLTEWDAAGELAARFRENFQKITGVIFERRSSIF